MIRSHVLQWFVAFLPEADVSGCQAKIHRGKGHPHVSTKESESFMLKRDALHGITWKYDVKT